MRPDESSNLESKPSGALVTLGLLVSVLVWMFSLRAYYVAYPPRFDQGWILSWIAAGSTSAFILAVSGRAEIGGRIILGFAAILSMLAFAVPTLCYFENYMDMPALAVLSYAFLHAVIGWRSKQKIIGLLPLALGAVMFFGARQSSVPLARRQQGDLLLESFTAESDGNVFHFGSASGKPIRASYDWASARIERVSIGPLLPKLRANLIYMPEIKGNELEGADLFLWMRMPTWARSWSGRLVVPKYPDEPAASVIVTPNGLRRVLRKERHRQQTSATSAGSNPKLHRARTVFG